MSDGSVLLPENAIETLRAMLAGTPELSGAEIVIRKNQGIQLQGRRGEIEIFEAFDEAGVGLRMARRGRLAQSFSSSFEMEALKEMVVRAMSALDLATDDPQTILEPMLFEGDVSAANRVDDNFAMIPQNEKMNRVLNLESSILKADSKITQVHSVTYRECLKQEWLWTMGSHRVLHSSKTIGEVGAAAIAADQGVQSLGWDDSTETEYFDLDWSAVGRNAAMMALKTLGGSPIPTGNYPVVFHSSVVCSLISTLARMFSGERIQFHESFLEGKLGKNLFSSAITLYDDPHQKKRAGGCWWDAEGTPTGRNYIVSEGRPEQFFHTRKTARVLGAKANGSAVRSNEKSAPVAGFHNLIVEPGRKDFVDLLRDMNSGLVIYTVKGLHGANLLTGEFSCGASGTWVENGKETRPVSQIALGGKLQDLFSTDLMVGRDVKVMPPIAAPSILFGKISVAGA